MIPLSVSAHPLWRLTVAGLLLLVVGCTVVLDKRLVTETPTVVEDEVLRPTGPPRAVIRPHPDGGGWTIEAKEPTIRLIRETTREIWEGRHYTWNPVVAPIGVVACPLMLAAKVLTVFDATVRFADQAVRFACARLLLGFNVDKSMPQPARDTITVYGKSRTEPGWRPIGGDVAIHVNDRQVLVVPLDQDGSAVVRVERLAIAPDPTHPKAMVLSIAVRQGDRALRDVRVTMDPARWAAWQASRPLARQRWPARLVVGLVSPEPTGPVSSTSRMATPSDRLWARLRSQLTMLLGARHVPLVSRARRDQTLLSNERDYQLSGRVADEEVVSPGHERGATVLLRPTILSGATVTLSVDVLAVESSELLASIPPMEGTPGDIELLADAMAARVAWLFEEAPGSDQTSARAADGVPARPASRPRRP